MVDWSALSRPQAILGRCQQYTTLITPASHRYSSHNKTNFAVWMSGQRSFDMPTVLAGESPLIWIEHEISWPDLIAHRWIHSYPSSTYPRPWLGTSPLSRFGETDAFLFVANSALLHKLVNMSTKSTRISPLSTSTGVDFIDEKSLLELFGYRYRGHLRRALDAQGVRYFTGRNGRIFVLSSSLEAGVGDVGRPKIEFI